MPLQAFPARQNDDGGGTRSKSGHVSGRALSAVTAVTGPREGSERSSQRRAPEQYAGPSGVPSAAAGSGTSYRTSATSLAGPLSSSEDSYEAVPLHRRSQTINAELVKLVASFAPLELAQLKVMEQKARIQKARAPAAAAAAADLEDVAGLRDTEARAEPQGGLERADSSHAAAAVPPVEQPLEPLRLRVRPSTADAARAPHPPAGAPAGRTRSQSATRPSHLSAAPAKGAVVKRDLNILPNPVAQKQTEAIQRQAAVSAFVKRLQREQDVLRTEKDRRLKAEQDALAAQLNEETREARAAAAEVTRVPEAPPVPARRKKPAPPSIGVNAALKDMQAAAQDVPEKKPIDAKPWRHNMRRQKNPPVAGEAPIGAPQEVPAKAASGAPPPRNVSPGAAAARAKTLDPVARTQLKEYMDRKAKDMAAKQLQEKAAQQEAKIAQLKVMKAEMAKARERAQKYAYATKENPPDYKQPRPAWVDIAPPESGSAAAAAPSRAAQVQRLYHVASAPDHDFVSERAMPYNMSDAMRMEATDRQRQERRFGSVSPTRSRGGRPMLVDNFGHPLGDDDWGGGPQVVRVHDPEMPEEAGRVYREGSARPTRPLVNPAPSRAQSALRHIQVGQPIAPETLRTIDLEARLAARKKYEQHQRELQAAERLDMSLGRDTSRGRDNSRGRRRSPTAGRKHEATSLNSRSRSPPKRAKQQMRRSRSASRAGSANRRVPAAEPQAATAGSRGAARLTAGEYPTTVQAGLQQARNERHVDSLWDLALQLSARLGALQQQGLMAAPQQAVQAWPDPQAQLEHQQLQAASLRGTLLPYPPPVAIVPTGLPTDSRHLHQDLAGPRQVEQYDEAVEADIEFSTEASWPIPGYKKMRTTGSSSVGADSSRGYGAPSRAGMGARSGAQASRAGGDGSIAGQSHGDLVDSSFSSDMETSAFEDDASMLTSGLHAGSVAAGTMPGLLARVSPGPSQGSLSVYDRDQDAASLQGRSDPASPAHRAWSTQEGGRGGRAASMVPGQPHASIPSSPGKQVPAAPVIQIPLLSVTSNVTADSVAPSVTGLPYDNATFSAESADDNGSSSGEESTYGQRVLTIAELQDVLVENPGLAQRLSLDRERSRWEEAVDTESPSRAKGIRDRPQQQTSASAGASARGRQEAAPLSPSYGGASDDSFGESGPGTPTRPCAVIVNEYEEANSPLRQRPAQRELLKAAKRADERLKADSSASGTEDEAEDLQLPKSGDPMSIPNLAAHNGRLPMRPTIIQLSEPLELTAADQETQTAEGSDPSGPGITRRRTSEVLLIPGPKGPHLVFSRELLHVQHQPSPSSLSNTPRKATKETGVGEGRVDHHAEPNGPSSQHLTDSLPPFVLVSASAASPISSVLQQNVSRSVLHTSRSQSSPATSSPVALAGSMHQQVDLIRSLHRQQLEERGLSGGSPRAEQRRQSPPAAAAAGGPDDSGNGLLGAMASPPPRPRVVTFLDETLGPPERVRLAPGELFNQMQNTLKTYEELDAAELELQQLQNARAIAAVQREAHRIAQRLDQSTAAEAQLQLIAQTQAEMDAKLHAFEATIRDEVRKDSLTHLHDVTSLFVEQLSRNKVVHTHSTAQTTPQPPSPPKPDFGVQVGPPLTQHPVSILRSSSPQQQQQAIAGVAATASRSPSPAHLHQTSLRPISPAQGTQSSLHQPHERLPSRGGSPGPGGRRNGAAPSIATTEYSEDFDNDELRQSSYISGRSASRVSFRQASHLSVPEEVDEETVTATSIPESVLDYHDRQLPRTGNRQTSFASVAESIPSERPASRSVLRQQASTLSVPESVTEDPAITSGRQPHRTVLQQKSTASIAESVGFDRSGGRHSSGGGTDSVPYTVAGASPRRRSTIDEDIPSDPTYSTAFDKDDDDDGGISEEDLARSRTVARTTHDDDYSADEVESESSGRRFGQRRRTATTVSARSPEVEESIRTGSGGGGSRSYSRDDDVAEDSGLVASGSSPHLQQRPVRPPAPSGFAAPGARDAHRGAVVAGVPITPPPARTTPLRGNGMLAGASPLSLRASMDGGLELDDDVMASYAADAENRMRQEVALLQDRLQDINRRAATKMDQLESELAAEAQPQKRQALIRAQRLLQVQHDADAADIQRQISAIKADFSRQRLMLERLVRLAQLTNPAGALAHKRAGAAPADEGHRPEHARAGAATLAPRPAERAPHASSSRSIEEDMSSRQLPSRSETSVAEEPLRRTRRPPSSDSVGEDIQKGSGTTEVAEEYSDQYVPSSIGPRSQLFPPSARPPRPTRQQSSIVDDVEESLSGGRTGTSGAQSHSVVTEEDNFKRSGSTAAAKSQRPASGSVATESAYSEDFDAFGGSAKPQQRLRAPPRRDSSTTRSDDLDSELSALSLKLEREKAALARQLRARRRAKIVAKQAEVERLRAELAAQEGKPATRAAAAPAKRKPPPGSDGGSEAEVEDEVSGYSRPGYGDSGSKAPSTVGEVQDEEHSVTESEIGDESEIESEDYDPSAQHSSPRSPRSPRNGTSTGLSPDKQTTSSLPSRDPDLAAVEKEIAALQEQVQRARQAKLEAAERQKRKLQAELASLTAQKPVSKPSGASEQRRAAPAPPAPRPYSTSTDSASYSHDFTSGSASMRSVPGHKPSSSVVDYASQSTLQRTAGQTASGSRSKSISEERISSLPSRGAGSHGGSVADETQRSSGGGSVRGAGHSSNSIEVYNESFETESARGDSTQDASDIQDEVGRSNALTSSDPTGVTLEPIHEDDMSGQSISYAADSVAGQSLRESVVHTGSDMAFGGFPAPSGDTRSIPESGSHLDDTAEDDRRTASHSIEDVVQQVSGGSDRPGNASQSVQDEQTFSVEDLGAHGASSGTSASMVATVASQSAGSQRHGKGSKDSPQVLSEEFFTTADINTPSVTPSIHSSELAAAAAATKTTSSVPTTGRGTRSVVSMEVSGPVAEFLTSAETGDSVTPSVLSDVQESSLQEEGSEQYVEQEEPLIVTQNSASSSSLSSSDSVSEEHGGAGAGQKTSGRSATVLDSSLPADEAKGSGSTAVVDEEDGEDEEDDIEVDYSEPMDDTGDIEVEEPHDEDEYDTASFARDATGQDSALDVAVAATEDLEETGAIESGDVVEDSTLQRSAATASADVVSGGSTKRFGATGSTAAVTDDPVQRSAATASPTASALPEEESQVDGYELDFEPSALEVPAEESSRRVLTVAGATASASRLVSNSGVVQEEEPEEEEFEDDYDLDFQPSALEVQAESSSRKTLQPPGATASASRLVSTGDIVQEEEEEDDDEDDDYELDFQASALDVPAEESSRRVLEPPAASASASRLVSTGEMVQDASELLAQTSLRDVASASSLGSRRLPVTSQASAKSLPSALQQQASSMSASTYEEDFEAGEVSELQLHGPAGLGRTTLSVVVEEGETKAEATGSKLYSEDFADADTLKSREEPALIAQPPPLPAVPSATESAASEVEDVDYDYEEDIGVEEDEDEQQFSAGSTGLVGPVLPPAVTNSVALEVSQRYGPASEQSSGGYSDDFTDHPGHDTLASIVEDGAAAAPAESTSSAAGLVRDTGKGRQPLMAEPRAESSLHKLASQSAERRVSAAPAAPAVQEPPPPLTAEPSARPPAQEADESMSVFSVEEESPTSATVSSEPSAQEVPAQSGHMAEPQDAAGVVVAAGTATATAALLASDRGVDDDGDDEYTRDFTDLHSNVEAQDSSNAVGQERKLAPASHPISQPPSPSDRSDGDAGLGAGAAADAAKESQSEEEVPDEEDLPEEDLDVDLDTPLAAVLAGKDAAALEAAPSGAHAERSASAASALLQAETDVEASASMGGDVDGEDSGILAVPRGRGIRQTRKIESRTWRNQQALLEDEEGGLSGDVDLLDISMAGGEGSGLLDMLGADLITEASEANTPSHSFRIRSGDATSAPSSGSPYGMRSALSVRLATLRESLDHEGVDTGSNSEVMSPSAARALQMSGEGTVGSSRSRQDEEGAALSPQGETAEDAAEIPDEQVIPSQLSGSEDSFLGPAPPRADEPLRPAADVPATEPLPEPFSAAEGPATMAAARAQPAPEASQGTSTRYSDDGLEAPPSEGSAGRQSVIEYDMYTSAALAEDDSDELKELANTFQSQALADDDEDDGGVAADDLGISASGLSDDLSKYKVTVQPDSDEEAGDSSRAPPATAVASAAAGATSPIPAPQEEVEDVPSVEPSEVASEELDAPPSDPFSVDESGDRLPTLQPVASVQPPAPPLAAAAPAAPQAVDELKGDMAERAAPAGPAAGEAPAVPSPTASSPISERNSHGALREETSLGPLPRSGLDDDEDEQSLEYRALYKLHSDESPRSGSPQLGNAEPAARSPPGGEGTTAAAVAEDGVGGKGGYLQALRAFAGSDDEEDELSGSAGGQGLSAAALKPMFQAFLDQPEAEGNLPKGDFESEIEEMLAASRSRSRLVSPYQSKDWAPDSDALEQDVNTPSSPARPSPAGTQPAATVIASPQDAAATAEAQEAQAKAAPPEPTAEPTRDHVVDEITDLTVKELVADAVEVMVGATGRGGSPSHAASVAAASGAQTERSLPALGTQDDAVVSTPAAEDSRVSTGGEASISMSMDDLEGDIELDADGAGTDSGAALDLPSPIPSDSGSLGSPRRSYGPGASKPSDPSSGTPALGPERSDRDLALSGSVPDETLGDSGVGLNSDEDLGWGGTDLDEDWQPDVSGLIAPEMDQAAIERENAPAVATGTAAVEEYAGQVLEQFMENRPEFLVPGAEPLSLEGFLDQERRLMNASEAQHIHNKMVYDAINEALLAIYRAANRIESQPWLRQNRIVKPLPSPAEMAKQVQQQLSAWAAMRMRDPAETDKVLAMDAQEDERARGDLALEEAEVQREVADLVWADLVEDTARELADLEQLLAPAASARGSMPAGGRRRLDALAP
ncbi:hypothetical protein PLESTF_000551400 [Pleodorina starrii]|nr:hypothetical protein PLESTF_000551400 [Pleodorina starrii]